jgi:hypothetical protein
MVARISLRKKLKPNARRAVLIARIAIRQTVPISLDAFAIKNV